MKFTSGLDSPRKPTLLNAFIDQLGIERTGRVFERICQGADEGDKDYIIFIGDRLIPKAKPSMSVRSSIRDIISLAEVEKANTTLINEMASGEITVEGGTALMDAVEKAGNAMVKDIIQQIDDRHELLKKGE